MTTTAHGPQLSEQAANLQVSGEIRAWLGRRGLRQAWLADLLGVGQSAVSKRLRGVLPFTVPELFTIAAALDISLGELLGDVVNEKLPHPRTDGGAEVIYQEASNGWAPWGSNPRPAD
ncbi:helix-turn-helix domain-containing protein [Brevibacterium sp. 5221]|uniref:Helix-turn-helix domain-containing protein n=1 Tax=Brevibacterium rongguiense TaxID=2695267 RepID=A0A6N9H808_9MICO|nr:helix-turn-helix domain-containing protein [Brevibacterium rongguiense]